MVSFLTGWLLLGKLPGEFPCRVLAVYSVGRGSFHRGRSPRPPSRFPLVGFPTREVPASLFVYHLDSVFWSSVREFPCFLLIKPFKSISVVIQPDLKFPCFSDLVQAVLEETHFLSWVNAHHSQCHSLGDPGLCSQRWKLLPDFARSLCQVSARFMLDGHFCLSSVYPLLDGTSDGGCLTHWASPVPGTQ